MPLTTGMGQGQFEPELPTFKMTDAECAEIAAEIDCLIDHNCTRAEFRDAKALYEGAKAAGLV